MRWLVHVQKEQYQDRYQKKAIIQKEEKLTAQMVTNTVRRTHTFLRQGIVVVEFAGRKTEGQYMKDKDLVELINDVDDLETAKQIAVELAKVCETISIMNSPMGFAGCPAVASQSITKCRELLGEK